MKINDTQKDDEVDVEHTNIRIKKVISGWDYTNVNTPLVWHG